MNQTIISLLTYYRLTSRARIIQNINNKLSKFPYIRSENTLWALICG